MSLPNEIANAAARKLMIAAVVLIALGVGVGILL